ncbi:ABC transporter ATP-binding protein [Phycisphaera mikurensis]|uniref:Putative ABC transporter ATP-binding protein n=1 Tax=Phycisphaera mikurensis (strain NBRC 102666 / KCTC 22515 / FYK2301M01) TaxID=1142394 RepID=I0IEE5_PHYMF|nr:ABC transporter ATP-binding protein [Phycisphaera mikurensis]MBB6441433.1 ABC-2 type transport system ATP-binding protein [Phycisphaera mikurensis]BAM03633.1 putative ABC transporter ATP-binding protein [Phycisphaera mikurensis NBRC 102666]
MIRLENLSKAFAGRPAVEGLSLEVPRGAIHGLLGHNGAGKSTTLGMLLGQVHPDAGRTLVNGHDVAAERGAALGRVGAIFEAPCFYDYLSARRNLRAFSNLTRRVSEAEIDAVVERVGLAERIHAKVSTYSHGMRQRLALAQALLPTPEVLILDEPTDGLDPQGIAAFRELLLELHAELDLTILFSSHLLAEVEKLCGTVTVLHRGRHVFEGDWRAATAAARRRVRIRTDRPAEALASLAAAGLVESADRDGQEPETVTVRGDVPLARANAHLVNAGFDVSAFAPIAPTLEAFYLERATKTEAARATAATRHGASKEERN